MEEIADILYDSCHWEFLYQDIEETIEEHNLDGESDINIAIRHLVKKHYKNGDYILGMAYIQICKYDMLDVDIYERCVEYLTEEINYDIIQDYEIEISLKSFLAILEEYK